MEALAVDIASPAQISQWIDETRRLFYADELDAAVHQGKQAFEAANALNGDLEQNGAAQDPALLLKAHTLVAHASLWLTRCERRHDRLDLALKCAYAGITAAQRARHGRLECQLRAQYVHLLASLGQNEEALDEGYATLRVATQTEDALAQASAWLALGHVHWAMQQWEDGHSAYTQSLTWAHACADKELCGLASNGIAAMEDQFAKTARAAGRLGDAEAHMRRCGELVLDFAQYSQEVGDRYNTWSAEHNYACYLFGTSQHEAARGVLWRQLGALTGEPGFRRHLAVRLLGDIDLAEGRLPTAITQLTEAMEIAERLHLPMFAMNACLSLVGACEKQGDLAAALTQHRRYHEFYVKLASNRAQAHARAMAVKYGTEKAQAVAEAQRLRAELLESTNSSLSLQAESLTRASMEDALTGIANRRRFDQVMRDDLPGRGATRPYSLALVDIDHFKRVNDTFSHMVGDEVLRRLGAILATNCRREDLAARYGGEEFVMIFSDVDRATSRRACERVRAAVAATDWSTVHPDLRVTVSIGVAHHDDDASAAGPPALLALADSRLYAAKHAGRNRVMDGDEPPASPAD